MGYLSRILSYKQLDFALIPGTTVEMIEQKLDESFDSTSFAFRSGYSEMLSRWFELEIDEESYLTLTPREGAGEFHGLDELMDALVGVLADFQDLPTDIPGIRFSYELWGEDAGDIVLYKSDGAQLYRIPGELSFRGEAVAVRQVAE